jgi:hypothetical protein
VAVIQSETDPPCEQLLAGMGHLVGGEVERWWWEAVVSMVMVVASAGASRVVVLVPIIVDSQHGGRGVSGDVAGLRVLGAAYLAGIPLQESPGAPRWSPWSNEEAPSGVLHMLRILRRRCSLLVVYILNISHIQLVSKLKQETKEKKHTYGPNDGCRCLGPRCIQNCCLQPFAALAGAWMALGVVGMGGDGVVVVIEVKWRERERQRWRHTLLIDTCHIGSYSRLEPPA